MNFRKVSLEKHKEWKGKLEVVSRVDVDTKEALAIAYTPGVAEPCLAIKNDPSLSFELTRRWNTVAVVTDGTAVLGLGDIGPEAGMPVMEGKCVLFKSFGNVDAIPICIRSKDVDEIVKTVSLIAGSFGGINLEDISAPRCFEIERRLKEICDIPIFHDDQHGTAIVVLAGILNALKIVKKQKENVKIVLCGGGSAGIAITKLLLKDNFKNIIVCGRKGALTRSCSYENPAHNEIAKLTNPNNVCGTLEEVIAGADIFIGVSSPNIVSQDMVRSMAKDAIVFAMANPDPEILPDLAKAAGARIVATGRSDFDNQINNLLAFPGIFRGALDVRAKQITDEMKLSAAYNLASIITDDKLTENYIIPSPLDKSVMGSVSKAVIDEAIRTGVAQKV